MGNACDSQAQPPAPKGFSIFNGKYDQGGSQYNIDPVLLLSKTVQVFWPLIWYDMNGVLSYENISFS